MVASSSNVQVNVTMLPRNVDQGGVGAKSRRLRAGKRTPANFVKNSKVWAYPARFRLRSIQP
jgi:hypothetical protein